PAAQMRLLSAALRLDDLYGDVCDEPVVWIAEVESGDGFDARDAVGDGVGVQVRHAGRLLVAAVVVEVDRQGTYQVRAVLGVVVKEWSEDVAGESHQVLHVADGAQQPVDAQLVVPDRLAGPAQAQP